MRDRHPGQLFFNAMKSLRDPKQHEDEKIKDHCSGVKSRITLLVFVVFNIMKWVDSSVDADRDPTKKIRKEFIEKFGAHFVQVRADLDQFGSPQCNCKQDCGLGQDHYKVQIDEAMEALVANQKQKKHKSKQ